VHTFKPGNKIIK